MKLKTNSLGLALATTAGLAYTLCAIFVYFFPGLSLTLVGNLFHLVNVGQIDLSWGGYLSGLIQVFIYCYLFGLVLGGLYNRLVKQVENAKARSFGKS